MPHLDLTYFLNQSFWCIFTFLLIYFTAGKHFFLKYSKILKNREDIVTNYIDKSKEILEKVKRIEEQLEESKRKLSDDIREQEENLRKKIFDIKNERLSTLKKEIENRNLAHKLFLNELKESLEKDLNLYSDEIKEKINLHLLGK